MLSPCVCRDPSSYGVALLFTFSRLFCSPVDVVLTVGCVDSVQICTGWFTEEAWKKLQLTVSAGLQKLSPDSG